jgi:hypothetical protein
MGRHREQNKRKMTPTQEVIKSALQIFDPSYKKQKKKLTPTQETVKEALQIFRPPAKTKS